VKKNKVIIKIPKFGNNFHNIQRYALLKDCVNIIISLVIIATMIIILLLVLDNIGGVEHFKSACESYNGIYYELQNVSCAIGHNNCRHICNLNGRLYDMNEIGSGFFVLYSKYFCVEDCRYENKNCGGICCVC